MHNWANYLLFNFKPNISNFFFYSYGFCESIMPGLTLNWPTYLILGNVRLLAFPSFHTFDKRIIRKFQSKIKPIGTAQP